ncbi:hypothetical protein [Serratia sp. 14-2641]|uniref:hypothetical protein n=1 Tax=Serratia sp. 14-2641 TaxID=1841657 RepID=UPI00080F87FE|nr:hypothetical protein [Serratia sp. 14-2641]OCJ22814.1 hypothetical protein A6U95_13640 [Serratia sp. 14-2641]
MNSQPLPPATLKLNQQAFCIRQKLKDTNNHWAYSFPVTSHYGNGNYSLVTEWADCVEYALYKRVGTNFILVDFFSEINAACDEAKEILCKIPKFEKAISTMASHIN